MNKLHADLLATGPFAYCMCNFANISLLLGTMLPAASSLCHCPLSIKPTQCDSVYIHLNLQTSWFL